MIVKDWDKTAVVHGDEKTSYKDLLKGITSASNLIEHLKANRVAIFGENSSQWAMAFFSSWKIHATAVPIDFMATPSEVAYILKDCKPEVFFISKANHDKAVLAIELACIETHIFIIDDIDLSCGEADALEIPEEVDDTAIIIYTSGTTGGPKGVMLSYRNILVNVHSVSHDVKIFAKDEVVLALLPFHHIFPLVGALVAPLFVGGSLVIPPSFATDDIIKSMRENQVTILISVPRFFSMLHKGIMAKLNKSIIGRGLFALSGLVNRLAFSQFIFAPVLKQFGGRIKHCPCGGAALEAQVEKDLKLLGFNILTGYGMSEAAPMISFTNPGDARPQTAGSPLPNIEIKIVDGEICVRGENVMKGYFNRPDETAETLIDGYLHTGDLGHIDEFGHLCITGRKKEIIVLPNGKNINPEEIEFKIGRENDVIEEIAIFFSDKSLQALIRPNFSMINKYEILNLSDYIQDQIIDRYNQEVAPYKKLTKFTIIKDELPRTRLGKLKRFELAQFVDQNKKRKSSIIEPDFEEYIILKDFLKVTSGVDIHPEDNIEVDLSLDSLDKVNLLAFIETSFGISIDEKILLQYLEVEKLAGFIRDNKTRVEVKALNWSEIIEDTDDIKLPTKSYFVIGVHRLFKVILNCLYRVRVKGTDYLPQVPCIIAPNHQSYFDGAFVTKALSENFLRNTFFGAKEKHVNRPVLRFMAERGNIIAIDLNRNLTESIRKMACALKTGKNLVIFPEGTRSKDGHLKDFKKLFAILSKELNVPVLPVCIEGAYKVLPSGSLFPKLFKKVQVSYLPPIFPEGREVEDITKQCFHDISAELKLLKSNRT